MFKKPQKVSTQTLLSSKDRKRVLRDFSVLFDPTATQALAQQTAELSVQKLEKTKILIYRDARNPLFVDSTSNNDYFPTVYALNSFPGLVSLVLWVPEAVGSFIANGANLMWKGVLNFPELPDFKSGQMAVARSVTGRNLGVGTFVMDKSTILASGRLEGVALQIIHFEGDWLFQTGDQVVKHGQGILHLLAPEPQDEGDSTEEAPGSPKQAVGLEGEKQGETENLPEMAETSPTPVETPSKSPDEQLMEAFLNALKSSLQDDQLPIENSSFWNQHLAPCAPGGLPDLKNTSYKKMGKFFTEMDELGLITYKEASKKQPTPVIEKVNRGHPLLKEWAVTSQKPVKRADAGNESKSAKFKSAFFIVNMYKPDAVAASFLTGPIQKEYFSRVEILESLRQKLEEEKLLFKDKVAVSEEMRADLNLNKAPQPKKKEKTTTVPTHDMFPALEESEAPPTQEPHVSETHPKNSFRPIDSKAQKVSLKTVEDALLLRCAPGHLVVDLRSGKQSTKKGSHFRLSLTVERNMNKFLTKISGLDTFGFNLKEVLGDLQVRFATSGSIHEGVLHKHPIEEVWLQGAFGEELKVHLAEVLGVDEDIIQIVDKAKVLKKK